MHVPPATAAMSTSATALMRALWLGKLPYEAAHQLQLRLVEERAAGRVPDTLLLLTHPPTITAGRSCTPQELESGRAAAKATGCGFAECERGGRLTFHGPGQLVAYPIFHLDCCGRDLHRWLWLLEEAVISTAARFGVGAWRAEERGVWTARGKIASVGVAVHRWVSYHGIALNVKTVTLPQGVFFCGLPPSCYSSLAAHGVSAELQDLGRVLAGEIAALCGLVWSGGLG